MSIQAPAWISPAPVALRSVPDVTGLPAARAALQLREAGLAVVFVGPDGRPLAAPAHEMTVDLQVPSAGRPALAGADVALYLR